MHHHLEDGRLSAGLKKEVHSNINRRDTDQIRFSTVPVPSEGVTI